MFASFSSVCKNPNEIKYYQVARSIADENVRNRELRSLEIIEDNYEKVISTMDKTINIIDFLLED